MAMKEPTNHSDIYLFLLFIANIELLLEHTVDVQADHGPVITATDVVPGQKRQQKSRHFEDQKQTDLKT